jgi:uracil phosphoribosyltransferase
VLPPASQIGPITAVQRQGLLAESIVAGVYEKTLDRDSAYEKLKGHAAARAAQADSQAADTLGAPAAPAGGMFDNLSSGLGNLLGGGGGRRTSAGEQLFKAPPAPSAARSAARSSAACWAAFLAAPDAEPKLKDRNAMTTPQDPMVHVISHPLVQHKLTLMRRKDASTTSFRILLNELSMLMAYEVTRDMPMQDIEIETPLETMTAKVIDGKKLALVSILRAGTGILDGMLSVVPGARVGHIGLYRDPATLQAVEYYFKMPKEMPERDVVVVDPMLATGHSAIAAITRIKALKPKSIKFVCLLTCPEGVKALREAHPDVEIFTAAIDRQLNSHGYILPGLGDAGDRIFGTQ